MSEKCEIPKEFLKVCKDFIKDLFGTFPDKINKASHPTLLRIVEEDEVEPCVYENIYEFCKEKYPKIFFDILYSYISNIIYSCTVDKSIYCRIINILNIFT